MKIAASSAPLIAAIRPSSAFLSFDRRYDASSSLCSRNGAARMSRFRCWRAGSLSIATATSRAIFVSAARSALGAGAVSDAMSFDEEGATMRLAGSAQAQAHASSATTRAPSPRVCLINPPRRVVR